MPSFLKPVFEDSDHLALEAPDFVKQESPASLDFLLPFSAEGQPASDFDPFGPPMLCPELDNAHSVGSSDSSASTTLTPPLRNLAFSSADIHTVDDCHEYDAPALGSIYSDFLGTHEEADPDLIALRELGRRNVLTKPLVPVISIMAPGESSVYAPLSESGASLTDPLSRRRRHLFTRSTPCVFPSQPLDVDVNDGIECPEASVESTNSAGRLFRVCGWSPPVNDKYPLANIELGGWVPSIICMTVPKLSVTGENGQVTSMMVSASQTLVGTGASARSQHSSCSELSSAETASRSGSDSEVKPIASSRPSRKKWARRIVSENPVIRRRRHPAHYSRGFGPEGVPSDAFDAQGLLVSTGNIQHLPSSSSCPQGSLSLPAAYPIPVSNCASLAAPESLSSSSFQPLPSPAIHQVSTSFQPNSRVDSVPSVRPENVQQRPQADLAFLRSRLQTILPPSLARAITRRARETRLEEYSRMRARVEEDMRLYAEGLQRDEQEETQRLMCEFLVPNAENAGDESGKGNSEGARSDSVALDTLKVGPPSSLGFRPPRSFHGLEYSTSTRRRALNRFGPLPGAMGGRPDVSAALARPAAEFAGELHSGQDVDSIHRVPALLTGSLFRSLSGTSLVAPEPGMLLGPSNSNGLQTSRPDATTAKRYLEGDDTEATAKRTRLA